MAGWRCALTAAVTGAGPSLVTVHSVAVTVVAIIVAVTVFQTKRRVGSSASP